MGTGGPTIELIEVAQEWRGRVIGRKLYCAMESHIMQLLLPLARSSLLPGQRRQLKLSACHVISDESASFFTRMGYLDADGMREELQKTMTYDSCKERWEADEEESYENERQSKAMDRERIIRELPEYNSKHGKHIVGKPVNANQRKACTKCGHNFSEYDDEWYFTALPRKRRQYWRLLIEFNTCCVPATCRVWDRGHECLPWCRPAVQRTT
jgi:hypothetical protein